MANATLNATVDTAWHTAATKAEKVYEITLSPMDNKEEELGSGHTIYTGRKLPVMLKALQGSTFNTQLKTWADNNTKMDIVVLPAVEEGAPGLLYRNVNVKKDFQPTMSADDSAITYDVFHFVSVGSGNNIPVSQIEYPALA